METVLKHIKPMNQFEVVKKAFQIFKTSFYNLVFTHTEVKNCSGFKPIQLNNVQPNFAGRLIPPKLNHVFFSNIKINLVLSPHTKVFIYFFIFVRVVDSLKWIFFKIDVFLEDRETEVSSTSKNERKESKKYPQQAKKREHFLYRLGKGFRNKIASGSPGGPPFSWIIFLILLALVFLFRNKIKNFCVNILYYFNDIDSLIQALKEAQLRNAELYAKFYNALTDNQDLRQLLGIDKMSAREIKELLQEFLTSPHKRRLIEEAIEIASKIETGNI